MLYFAVRSFGALVSSFGPSWGSLWPVPRLGRSLLRVCPPPFRLCVAGGLVFFSCVAGPAPALCCSDAAGSVLVSASRSLWLFAFSWASLSPLLALRSLSVRVCFCIRGILVARSPLSFVSSQLLFLDDQWIHICSHLSAIPISIVTSQIHN